MAGLRGTAYELTELAYAELGPRPTAPGRRASRDLDERYTITDAGRAALATSPADDLDHEPRHGCDGRGCQCAAGRWSRVRPR